MTTLTQAHELTLREIKQKFNLRQVDDPKFFPEWQSGNLGLGTWERTLLDRARTDFLYLAEDPVQEEIVKLVILSPLLSAAGFYRHPFRPVAERQVEIVVEEDGATIRGRLDILLLNEVLWVAVLEAKNKRFNVLEALPQTLFYMLASPSAQTTLFGLATNGSEFLLLKLLKTDPPQYALSRLFSLLNPENDLYPLTGILQYLGQRVFNSV